MPKNINTFGGYRLVGFIDRKPLIAKFKITPDSFDAGFNQNILDPEYCGKFHKLLLGKKFEYPKDRYTAANGKSLQSKGGRTTESTLAWIASLINLADIDRASGKNNQISRETFIQIAQAIYASNVFYAKGKEDLVVYRDIAELFKLQPTDNRYLLSLLSEFFTQYRSNLSVFSEIVELKNRVSDIQLIAKAKAA